MLLELGHSLDPTILSAVDCLYCLTQSRLSEDANAHILHLHRDHEEHVLPDIVENPKHVMYHHRCRSRIYYRMD